MKSNNKNKTDRASIPQILPDEFVSRIDGDTTLIIRKQYEGSRPLSEILSGEHKSVQDVRMVISGGRGTASVHAVSGIGDVVLRRYRRGGLVGKVLVDRYLSGTRPFRELSILLLARDRGVPVPEAVGASVIRAGLLWHRGRIVTRLIPGARTLPVFIEKNRDNGALVVQVLEETGNAIRLMHEAGIDHADLNMNNVLVDDNDAACIIDFDKAASHREFGLRRRIRNLRRLLRSLRKLRTKGRPLRDDDFSMIIRGYAGDDPALLAAVEKGTLGSRLLLLRSLIKGTRT